MKCWGSVYPPSTYIPFSNEMDSALADLCKDGNSILLISIHCVFIIHLFMPLSVLAHFQIQGQCQDTF